MSQRERERCKNKEMFVSEASFQNRQSIDISVQQEALLAEIAGAKRSKI